MELTIDQQQKIQNKLVQLAEQFPDVDFVDLERVDKFAGMSQQVRSLLLEEFFPRLERDVAGLWIKSFCHFCLQYSWPNLSEAFVGYCLDANLINDVKQQWDLVLILTNLLVRYNLSSYIDADRQSDHIRFIAVHGEVNFSIGLLPNTERLHVLKLLRDKYVSLLCDSSPVVLSVDQSLLIDKHERVTMMIRKTDRSILEEHRWARLYAVENLRFGAATSKALFHDAPDDPDWFDKALYTNFKIMLFPAMGNVELRPKQLRIMNEGSGSIRNPQLEIWVDDRVIVILNSNGVIEAGTPCLFMLNDSQIVELKSVLSNYQQVSLRLVFKKFNSSFRLTQLLATDEIFSKLLPKETDVELLARKVGVSPERLKEFVERKISSEQDLFNAVKDMFIQVRHIVEQQDGHQQLTDKDGKGRKPRSEDDIQVSLRHWLEPMCKTHNIDLVREQKSGRGLIDFAFSIGSDMKCLVEIKPAYSAKLDYGISTQLPTYLHAEQKRYGIYVPIMFDSTEYDDDIKIVREKANQVNQIPNIEIAVVDIRAWKPDTASKTLKLDDFDRYQP